MNVAKALIQQLIQFGSLSGALVFKQPDRRIHHAQSRSGWRQSEFLGALFLRSFRARVGERNLRRITPSSRFSQSRSSNSLMKDPRRGKSSAWRVITLGALHRQWSLARGMRRQSSKILTLGNAAGVSGTTRANVRIPCRSLIWRSRSSINYANTRTAGRICCYRCIRRSSLTSQSASAPCRER